MPEPEPRYDARTVEAPDGTRVTVTYKPGSRTAYMTEAELLADWTARQPPRDHDTGGPLATVTNLAAERDRRRRRAAMADEPHSEIVDIGGTPIEMRTVHGTDGTTGTLGRVPGAYDHLTDDEVIAMMRNALGDQLEDD